MDVIYADELLALNFLVDYLLLLSAARLRGAPLHRGRFALGAGVGAVYALLAVLPGLEWVRSPAVKLAASALMGLIAYGGESFFSAWLWLLGLSAGFGGAVYAAALLAGQNPDKGLWVPVSGRILLLSFGVCYGGVRLFFGRFLQQRERVILPVTVGFLGQQVSFRALRDTGNGLHDAVTGLPVLVADRSVILPLLPGEAADCLALADAAEQLQALSALPGLTGRFRLVPYTAVGTARGLLLCFRPDRLTVENRPREMLLALSPTPLTDGGDYAAIV